RCENAGVVDQEIKAAAAQRVGHAGGPRSHGVFPGDVADRQADAAAGGLLQILDFPGRDGRTENDVTLAASPSAMSRPRPPPAPVIAADRPEFFDANDMTGSFCSMALDTDRVSGPEWRGWAPSGLIRLLLAIRDIVPFCDVVVSR